MGRPFRARIAKNGATSAKEAPQNDGRASGRTVAHSTVPVRGLARSPKTFHRLLRIRPPMSAVQFPYPGRAVVPITRGQRPSGRPGASR